MSDARTEGLIAALDAAASSPDAWIAWQRGLRELVGLAAQREAAASEFARALCELRRVHHAEQQMLLRAASALRDLSRDEGGTAATTAWRARAREELRLAREDGFEAAFVLAECVLRPRALWRTAGLIARAAEELARERAEAWSESEAPRADGSTGRSEDR